MKTFKQFNEEINEEIETTDEARLPAGKSKAARLFRQGQKQHDWKRQAKAAELKDKASKARAKRLYDKKSPEEKQADADWARERHHHALHGGQPGHAY